MPSYGSRTKSPVIASQTALRSEESASQLKTSNLKVVGKDLKVPQKDLLVFFRQLAVILQSGVPLAQGLTLIAENMTNQKLASCVLQIAGRLSAGEELSLSLRNFPKVFEPLTVGLIEAGEAGGILESVLDRIALLMEEKAKLRGQLIGAMIYPAIVLLLAVSVSLGLLIFIVPKFKEMFDNMGAELPGRPPAPTSRAD